MTTPSIRQAAPADTKVVNQVLFPFYLSIGPAAVKKDDSRHPNLNRDYAVALGYTL
jgi:hypothetical protein